VIEMCPYTPPPTTPITAADVWTYSDRRLVNIRPSDTLRISNDAEKSIKSTAWTRMKEIASGVAGAWRVRFELKTPNSAYEADGRVYKNNEGVGLTRSTTSTSYVAFTEDLPFAQGDAVQLFAHGAASDVAAYVRNFRLYGDLEDLLAYNTLT